MWPYWWWKAECSGIKRVLLIFLKYLRRLRMYLSRNLGLMLYTIQSIMLFFFSPLTFGNTIKRSFLWFQVSLSCSNVRSGRKRKPYNGRWSWLQENHISVPRISGRWVSSTSCKSLQNVLVLPCTGLILVVSPRAGFCSSGWMMRPGTVSDSMCWRSRGGGCGADLHNWPTYFVYTRHVYSGLTAPELWEKCVTSTWRGTASSAGLGGAALLRCYTTLNIRIFRRDLSVSSECDLTVIIDQGLKSLLESLGSVDFVVFVLLA